jgi:hypothetical protein
MGTKVADTDDGALARLNRDHVQKRESRSVTGATPTGNLGDLAVDANLIPPL